MQFITKFKHHLLRLTGSAMLAILFALFGHVSGADAASIAITGSLTYPNGNPIQNAAITATAPGGSTVNFGPSYSTASGSYELDVDPGTYDFHFTPPSGSGLNPVVESNFTVLTDQVIDVQFTPITYTYSGTITDQNGDPLTGMNVSVGGIASGNTDSSGNFSVTAPAGSYTIQFTNYGGQVIGGDELAGFTTNVTTADLTSGNVTQNFSVDLAHLTVTATDSSGNPEPGAYINISGGTGTMSVSSGDNNYSPTGANIQINGSEPQTDTNGAVTVLVPQGATYTSNRICAYFTDSTSACESTPTTVSADTTVNLAEALTYTYSGTITDQNGDPLTGMNVSVGGIASGNTDSSGNFSVTAPAGSYTIQFTNYGGQVIGGDELAGFTTNVTTADLTSGNVTQNFSVDLAHLTVTATDSSGNPEPGAYINISGGTGTMSVSSGDNNYSPTGANIQINGSEPQTDTNGAVTVLVPQGATYTSNRICAYFRDSTSACESTPTTVSADTTVNLAEALTYTYSGTITDQNGDPLTGMNVSVGGIASGNTDSSGNFSVTAPAGSYTIQFTNYGGQVIGGDELAGFTTNVTTADLTSGNVTQNFEINLANLTVVTKDSSGNPLANNYINISGGTGTMSVSSGDNNYSPTGANIQINGSEPQTDTNGAVTVLVPQGATYTSNRICAYFRDGTSACNNATLAISQDTSLIFQQGGTVTVAIGAPTNLTIPSPTAAPVLSWTGVTGATSYDIYANGNMTPIGNTTSTTYTDNNPVLGSDAYYVTAVNAGGQSGPSNVVTVLVGAAPTITSPAIDQIDARDVVNFIVTTTGSPTPSLTESGALPTGIAFTDNGDGTASISGQASTTNTGYYFITITATSSAGTATQNFVLTVDNLQEAPTIISANTLTETNGTPFSFTVDTTGDPTPSIIKVSGSGSLPTGVTLRDMGDGTATISGTPTGSASGVYTFTIRAHNKNGNATQVFTLYVNSASGITSKAGVTATNGTAMAPFTVTTSGYPAAALTETGTLPIGLSFVDNGDGTGTISGTPTGSASGVYTVTITATNGIGAPATQTFTFTIDQAPAITSAANETVATGTASSFQVTSTGFPAATYSLSGTLPAGLSITRATGVLKTTANTPAGTYTFTITATNGTGTTTQTFTLTVS